MDRQISIGIPESTDLDKVSSILEGRIDAIPSTSSRLVRIFVSSTFSDMVAERNAMMEHVYPELKEYCRGKYGLEFQIMDLRWGIQEAAHNDHQIIDFCLREIKSCKASSIGPNFVMCLAIRYFATGANFSTIAETQQVSAATVSRCVRHVSRYFYYFHHRYIQWPRRVEDKMSIARKFFNNHGEKPLVMGLIDGTHVPIVSPKKEREPVFVNRKGYHSLNTIILLGQKYGYRPFPPEIADKEFLLIRKALEAEDIDVSLLDTWFVRDDNIIPAMYSLWPISKVLPFYGDKSRPEQAAEANTEWTIIFDKLRALLRQGVSRCVRNQWLPLKERDKYFISVTEYEIREGMPVEENSEQTCLTMVRHVDDLEENTDNPRAVRFIDLDPGTNKVNQEAQDLLRMLRDLKIKQRYSDNSANMQVLHTKWGDRLDEDPNTDSDYLKTFCDTFYDGMVDLIRGSMDEQETLVSESLVVEVIQHLELCRMRCSIFKGRDRIINRIRDYITGRSIMPLVIHGVSGSGKTSVIAKAASKLHSWMAPHASPILVLRFLGTSARSTSIRLVLANMCWQIAEMYGCEVADIPTDYPELIVHFHELLKRATAERPLVVMLDSLDQLSSSQHAHNLMWLPRVLPPHVKLIVSTLPIDHDLLATLMMIYTNMENYIKIQPLGQSMSMEIIRDWLNNASRQLTPAQMVKVQTALHYCSLPLYTKLVFEEVMLWKSYLDPKALTLETTIKGVINKLLDRTEHHHGKTFVKHALSYITASRNGLGDTELEDTMSLDDVILNDVFTYWIPPTRRIPPVLWPRLLDDLKCYVVKREANGVLVNYWYHRQFITVTKERYLSDAEDRRYIHSILADYYLGLWAGGKKKPFHYSDANMRNLGLTSREGKADRKVPHQPLTFGVTKNLRVRYNLRKLSELPYHLIMSGRITDLNREILFNYKWLHTKLQALSLPDILADFRQAMDEDLGDEEIKILSNTLRMGGSYVNKNPATLGFDLLGHLLPFYDTLPNLRSLLQQCDESAPQHSSLLPIFQCFESPSEMLLYVLEEHSKSVVDLLFSKSTNELVSLSKDGTIAFWNLDTGEKSRTLDVSELNPGAYAKLLQSNDGKYLVCDSDSETPVFVFEMKTGRLLHKCGKRDQTQKRVFVVQNLLCHKKSIINMQTGRVLNELQDFTKTRHYVTMAITQDEKHVLIGEDKVTRMYDVITKKVVASFPGENIPSVFKVTIDSRKVYAGYAVDCLFKVFDIDRLSQSFGQVLMTFNYQKAFSSNTFLTGSPYNCEVAEIAISKNDPCTVVINLRRCNLVVIKVKEKLISDATLMDVQAVGANNNTSLFNCHFSPDGQYVLAGEKNTVYIWRATSGAHLSSLNIHSIGSFPMAVSPRHNLVATASNIHTAIKVWDIDKIHKVYTQDLRIYENPVDMVACAWHSRLLFVKEYYSLNSLRGYKHLDCFGLDVWNLSTGTCLNYLPFGQYGELKQLEVSPDGEHLLMLLAVRDNTYVCVVNTNENGVSATLKHQGAKWITMNHSYTHLASYSETPKPHIRLWSLLSEVVEEVVTFNKAFQAMFTYDGDQLVVLDSDGCIGVFDLHQKIETPLELLPLADSMQLLPCHHDTVIVTRENEYGTAVDLWNMKNETLELQLELVAPGGLVDISKDGKIGIDRYLQVFDLVQGKKLNGVSICDESKMQAHEHVRLTHDGKYAVWIEDLIIKACRLSDGHIVATTSMHEEPTSLVSLDHGYFFVIGRKDGHVIPMKLVDGDRLRIEKEAAQCETTAERTDLLLNMAVCSETLVSSFEPLYQHEPKGVPDNEVPKASNKIQLTLSQKARVPFAVIHARSMSRDDGDTSPGNKRRHRATSEENLSRLITPRGSLNDLVAAGNRIIKSVAPFGSTECLFKGSKK